MNQRALRIFIMFAPLLLTLTYGAAGQSTQTISHIYLEGFRRVDRDAALSLIQSRTGGPYKAEVLLNDLQTLEHSKYFESASLELQDDPVALNAKIVTFRLTERPVIARIEYDGLSSVAATEIDDRLKARNVDLAVGSFYDPAQLASAQTAIHDLLAERGHPAAGIHLSYEPITRENAVDLVFTISEGSATR